MFIYFVCNGTCKYFASELPLFPFPVVLKVPLLDETLVDPAGEISRMISKGKEMFGYDNCKLVFDRIMFRSKNDESPFSYSVSSFQVSTGLSQCRLNKTGEMHTIFAEY